MFIITQCLFPRFILFSQNHDACSLMKHTYSHTGQWMPLFDLQVNFSEPVKYTQQDQCQ